MALTRKQLKGMGLTEEQIDSVIEAHTETVDGLKAQMESFKADAAKLQDVQKQLDELKAGKDWKAEHDKLKKSFDDYKTEVASKEALASKKSQYRKMLDDLKINKDDAELIMAATDWEKIKLGDDGNLSDAETLKKTAQEQYKRYIPNVEIKGAGVDNPPKDKPNNGANPRAAEIARAFHERRYGKAPEPSGANKND